MSSLPSTSQNSNKLTEYKKVPSSFDSSETQKPIKHETLIQNERSSRFEDLIDSSDELDLELEIISVRFYIGFLFASSILNIFHFFIGISNLKNCTIRPAIPIWLIIFGILGVINLFLILIGLSIKKKHVILFRFILVSSFVCFFVCFFIGNVLILTVRSQVEFNHSKCLSHYCDEMTFTYSIWSIFIYWALYGCLVMCIAIYYIFFIKK